MTGDSVARSVFSLLHHFVLVAVTAENPASRRQDVGNGSSVVIAFVVILWIFCLGLESKMLVDAVDSNILLKPLSFEVSSSYPPAVSTAPLWH